MTAYIVTTADNVEHRVERGGSEDDARQAVHSLDPTLGIIRVQVADAPSRAEQAKALISRLRDASGVDTHGINERVALMDEAAAALTASEAEVTRLEIGIAEAFDEGVRASGASWGHKVFALRFLNPYRALSQPTTDTNGAHA